MDDISTLTTFAHPNEHVASANNIITNYDLHFTTEEILKAFKNIQQQHACSIRFNLMYLALTTNLRMFIAIIYAALDCKMPSMIWCEYLITRSVVEGYKLGCGIGSNLTENSMAVQIYCTLYDYYEFDISGLLLCDKLRDQIQQHINNGYSYTKRAIKKWSNNKHEHKLVYHDSLYLMDDIIVLASSSSTSNELTLAANNIITNYDLHFTVDDMIKAFRNLSDRNTYHVAINAAHLTLTTNLRMFIAIMYAALDDTMLASWCYYLILHQLPGNFKLGRMYSINDLDFVASVYNRLYDYYEFDITNLTLSYELRELIQQHIDSKHSYTKRAIKKWSNNGHEHKLVYHNNLWIMDDIKVLASSWSSSIELKLAANNIITNYDLHFTIDDMIKAFKNMQQQHARSVRFNLMYLALTTNLRMFIAIIYASLDDKMPSRSWCNYLILWSVAEGYALGCSLTYDNFVTVQIYCTLYDYYDFDISRLSLCDELRNQIQQHIDSKRSHTKGAIKKWSNNKHERKLVYHDSLYLMDDIIVLASSSSTSNELTLAANNIVTNYDLHFTVDDMIKAFRNLSCRNSYPMAINVAHLTLTTNLRMFIAIMYTALDDTMLASWCYYLILHQLTGNFKLGCTYAMYDLDRAASVYNILYDHYEFDITNLTLSDELRELIQQHIDSKHSYTKRAIKKWSNNGYEHKLVYHNNLWIMDDIKVLASSWSSSIELKLAANNIITNYDLHFTIDDMIKAFKNLLNFNTRTVVINMTHLTLTTNLRMFIATMYAALDNKMQIAWCHSMAQTYFRCDQEQGYHFKLGYTTITNNNYTASIYNTLYDYYEFDITNLDLSDGLRKLIQQHIDSKITYTKKAVKQPWQRLR